MVPLLSSLWVLEVAAFLSTPAHHRNWKQESSFLLQFNFHEKNTHKIY